MGTHGNPHVGDVDVRLKITVKEDADNGLFPVVDLGDFATRKMIIQAPDKSENEVTASLNTDGSDGVMYYDSVAATFGNRGTYRRQPKITSAGGSIFKGSWISFEVDP